MFIKIIVMSTINDIAVPTNIISTQSTNPIYQVNNYTLPPLNLTEVKVPDSIIRKSSDDSTLKYKPLYKTVFNESVPYTDEIIPDDVVTTYTNNNNNNNNNNDNNFNNEKKLIYPSNRDINNEIETISNRDYNNKLVGSSVNNDKLITSLINNNKGIVPSFNNDNKVIVPSINNIVPTVDTSINPINNSTNKNPIIITSKNPITVTNPDSITISGNGPITISRSDPIRNNAIIPDPIISNIAVANAIIADSIIPNNMVADSIIHNLKESRLMPVDNITKFAFQKNISIKLASTDLDPKLNSDKGKAVMELEKRIITMQGHCPSEIVDKLKVRTFQLDGSLMDKYASNDVVGTHKSVIFNSEFQDGMGCLIDALISDDDLLSNQRLKQWIKEINRIGEESEGGMVFRTKTGECNLYKSSCNSLYVIKTPINWEDDSLAHEAVVGMGAINKLRNKIPTFAHTYGAFMCSPPILDQSGKVISWCANKSRDQSDVTYLIIENINDSDTLSNISPKLSREEFLQIYLQIINALNIAYKDYDFTHYDLHPGNVLIQTLPYKVAVPFHNPSNKTIMYIITNKLARIIDYGTSHIYLQGRHLGKYGLEYIGIDPESSFPMYDAYKLLLGTYWYILNNNPDSNITPIVKLIYSFFLKNASNQITDLSERMKIRDNDPYNDFFQPDNSLKNITFDDLLLYMLDVFSENIITQTPTSLNDYTSNKQPILSIFDVDNNRSKIYPGDNTGLLKFLVKDRPDDVVLTTCNNTCNSVPWDSFLFDKSKIPNTMTEFCQINMAINNLTDKSYKDNLKSWISQLDAQKIYMEERNNIVNELNNTINNINNIVILTIDDPVFDLNIYRNNIYNLAVIKSGLTKISVWISSVICVFNSNKNLKIISEDIQNILDATRAIDVNINNYKEIIKYNMLNFDNFDQDINSNHYIILYTLRQQ